MPFSTFPQTHIFFVPNIKGLAQTVLTWEVKVFAAVDGGRGGNELKTVTPDRGDLMSFILTPWSSDLVSFFSSFAAPLWSTSSLVVLEKSAVTRTPRGQIYMAYTNVDDYWDYYRGSLPFNIVTASHATHLNWHKMTAIFWNENFLILFQISVQLSINQHWFR